MRFKNLTEIPRKPLGKLRPPANERSWEIACLPIRSDKTSMSDDTLKLAGLSCTGLQLRRERHVIMGQLASFVCNRVIHSIFPIRDDIGFSYRNALLALRTDSSLRERTAGLV